MFVRLIFLLLAGYFLSKLLRGMFLTPKERPRRHDETNPPKDETATVLTSCPRCGTFFKDSQGVRGLGGQLFCSEACRDKK